MDGRVTSVKVATSGAGRAPAAYASHRRWLAFRQPPCLDAAVMVHDVVTDVETRAGAETLRERETIVFARQDDGHWVAVHEHLSPAP